MSLTAIGTNLIKVLEERSATFRYDEFVFRLFSISENRFLNLLQNLTGHRLQKSLRQ